MTNKWFEKVMNRKKVQYSIYQNLDIARKAVLYLVQIKAVQNILTECLIICPVSRMWSQFYCKNADFPSPAKAAYGESDRFYCDNIIRCYQICDKISQS